MKETNMELCKAATRPPKSPRPPPGVASYTGSSTNGIAYDARGNIQAKSDLGNYTMNYGANGKPHALTSISGVPSNFPANTLSVTCTDFKKIKTLTEGNKFYQLTYGVDEQRRKSVYKENNTLKETRYYIGDYEEKIDHSGGITEKIHYLNGAIYMERSNGTNNFYYAYTDYQGSLTALVNEGGTIAERYAYDPWGKRRNPNNWMQDDTRTSWIVNRGYTGHEHINQFGIINMNGRVYDPLTAQFFSPDPYLQAPGDWLNYNRYTYCLNNPFKYTDPTGEIFVIDDLIIAMAVSAVLNVHMQNMAGNLKSGSDLWNAAGIGALAGAAGYGAGSLVSNVVAPVGAVGGGLTGAAAGAAGGFVGSAGNAWANGASFGAGLKAGLIGGAWGALGGGILGGINGGITAYRHGGNLLTGEGSIFETVANVDPTKPVRIGEGMTYSNEYAAEFSDSYFRSEDVIGVTNLYADGTMPGGYEKAGDYVKNVKNGGYVDGLTKYLGRKWLGLGPSKGSNVYLYKNAFTSKEKLFLVMGHEYIHSAFNFGGHLDINRQEAVAYKWSYDQATKWSLTGYKSAMDYYAQFNKTGYIYRLKRIGDDFMKLYSNPW